jgi:sec-independent protein translocase protein TatA
MGFNGIGIGGLIIILIVALLVFGPSKLPELGRAFGKTLREFRNATRDLTADDDDGSTTSKTNKLNKVNDNVNDKN